MKLERPTRKLIIEELKMLKDMNKKVRGNIYYENLIQDLVITSWDFLQRRKNISNEKKEMLKTDIITFKERVFIEINESQNDYVGVEPTMEGLTEDEIKELTKNFELN